VSFNGIASINTTPAPPGMANQVAIMELKIPACLYPYPDIISDQDSAFQFDVKTLDRFNRFKERTVLSFGGGKTGPIYRRETIKLVLAVRAKHIRS
jgi:hypothetical protein